MSYNRPYKRMTVLTLKVNISVRNNNFTGFVAILFFVIILCKYRIKMFKVIVSFQCFFIFAIRTSKTLFFSDSEKNTVLVILFIPTHENTIVDLPIGIFFNS